jgi:hypothetical protein
MEPIKIIAQAVSILAMALNIISYQNKSQRAVITFQLFGGALFAVSFGLLSSWMGMLLNVLAAVRAIVYRYRKQLHANHILWLCGFVALYLLCYLATFVWFDTEPTAVNLIVEVLPVIGMTASNISFRMRGARAIRFLGLVSSPSWLAYNIVAGSVGAILCEVISLVSIAIGIWRFDVPRRSSTQE